MQYELVHLVIDTVGGYKTPRWLTETNYLHVAGEGKLIQQNAKDAAVSPVDQERKLAAAKTSSE